MTVAVKPLGKIQIRIWRLFVARPDAVVTTTELCRWAFPRALGAIRNKHRLSARRAAVSVARRVGRSRHGKGRPLLWAGKCSGVAKVLPNAKNEAKRSNEKLRKTGS